VTETMTARDIVLLLAERHSGSEWAFAAEVPTATGFLTPMSEQNPLKGLRRIDAFAMNLWPSKKYKRIAYEIKVARSDWLAECQTWEKHAQAYLLAHEMYVVAPPGVVRDEDLHLYGTAGQTAQHCGLIEATPGGLVVRRKAIPGDAWPMPEAFVASLLRHVVKTAEDVKAWSLTK
jgi:hypothetical protein